MAIAAQPIPHPHRTQSTSVAQTVPNLESKAGESTRLTGHIKWYDAKKGFGFIARPGEKDVFVHSSDLRKSGVDEDLAEGDPVTFEAAAAPKGLKAVNVRRGQ